MGLLDTILAAITGKSDSAEGVANPLGAAAGFGIRELVLTCLACHCFQ